MNRQDLQKAAELLVEKNDAANEKNRELMAEIESLRKERDLARRDYEVMNKFREAAEKDLEAALEREQALAAHVERMKQEWEKRDGHEVSEHDKLGLLLDLLYGEPCVSLEKRDLVKQAEALEDRADCIMAEAGYLENFRREVAGILRSDANNKRQQAAAL